MSSSSANPYASPEVGHQDPSLGLGELGPVKRPKSPMVFGVLSIVFAVLGLAGTVANFALQGGSAEQQEILAQLGYSPMYVRVTQVVGMLMSGYLLWVGTQLVRYRHAGRVGFTIYAWLTIVMSIGNALYTGLHLANSNQMEGPILIGVLVGSLIGSAMSLIYPVLGMALLNRQRVKDALT